MQQEWQDSEKDQGAGKTFVDFCLMASLFTLANSWPKVFARVKSLRGGHVFKRGCEA